MVPFATPPSDMTSSDLDRGYGFDAVLPTIQAPPDVPLPLVIWLTCGLAALGLIALFLAPRLGRAGERRRPWVALANGLGTILLIAALVPLALKAYAMYQPERVASSPVSVDVYKGVVKTVGEGFVEIAPVGPVEDAPTRVPVSGGGLTDGTKVVVATNQDGSRQVISAYTGPVPVTGQDGILETYARKFHGVTATTAVAQSPSNQGWELHK